MPLEEGFRGELRRREIPRAQKHLVLEHPQDGITAVLVKLLHVRVGLVGHRNHHTPRRPPFADILEPRERLVIAGRNRQSVNYEMRPTRRRIVLGE